MSEYLADRYVYGVIDHPFDLVELAARIWVLIITLILFIISISTKVMASYQLLTLALFTLILFFVHLACKKVSPHRFHPPHVKSINVPLGERLRTSNVYILTSSGYLANFILSWIGLIPNINTTLFWDWLARGINFITVAVFMTALLVYVGTIKPAVKKIPLPFLLGDLIILGSFCLYFVHLILTNHSLEVASEIFGEFLLGSITLMIARDLFLGKWTHNLPIATK